MPARALIGLFLIVAAIRAQPREARGLDGALAALAQQPFGPWLLALVAYGIFALVEARYRRMLIRPPALDTRGRDARAGVRSTSPGPGRR